MFTFRAHGDSVYFKSSRSLPNIILFSPITWARRFITSDVFITLKTVSIRSRTNASKTNIKNSIRFSTTYVLLVDSVSGKGTWAIHNSVILRCRYIESISAWRRTARGSKLFYLYIANAQSINNTIPGRSCYTCIEAERRSVLVNSDAAKTDDGMRNDSVAW